ncbi:LIC11966 family surface protein [Ekhidna sp.]
MNQLKSLFLLLLSFNVLAQNSPVDHLNKLSTDYDQINKDTWDYVRQASRGKSANKLEKRRTELASTLKTAKYNVSKVPVYQGDNSLKKAYINYLGLTYNMINNDYKKIVDMEKVAEDSYDAMEAYLLTKERTNKRMDSASTALSAAQDEYVKKYNITVREDKSRISRKLNNAGSVIEYYNKIYLIFYKSSFYEGEMINAISSNNVGDIEQFRQTLEMVSKEGTEDLAKIGSFRDDNTLKDVCFKMLEFYYGEAVKYMPKQVEFYAKKDRFETLSKNINAKKQKQLTQKEVDDYNKAVEEYNAAINDFNETNDYLNKYRSKRFKDFNDAIENFYRKFM